MGVVKILGKAIGTTALTVTGITATVVKTCADSVGNEFWSTFSNSAKNASFNGIKKMWSNKKVDKFTQNVNSITEKETLRNARDGYLNKAKAAKKFAEAAKQKGNETKQKEYESEYERCMNMYNKLDLQYRNAIK